MFPDIWAERLLWTVALVSLGVAGFALFNRFTLRRATSKVAQLSHYRPGLPALVYFTTPQCVPCKLVQRPTIERLKRDLGQWFQVIEVDASAHPQLAESWGVMSVPTTFVIDANGQPRYVNHGVVRGEALIEQLGLEDYAI